ncbi:hypothetical protein [Vibrio maritimus]|nr:hypothetical protein [Vibrio maritimus]
MNFKRSFLYLSTLTLPTFAFSHGNVDISNGSHIEVYFADEQHHGHSDNDTERVYGIEGVWMDDSGVFIYGEAETGAHEFYQLGGGKYFNPTDNIGWFAYGAYAQGGYLDSNELRARIGLDYQVSHELSLKGRLGYDYGNSKISLGGDHDHDHGVHHEHHHSSKRSQLGRMDLGFNYELGHVAEFSYNYVVQKQFESDLVLDNDTNLHYEARLTYTDTKLQPYVEYRQTNKAFDDHHFEEKAVQFGVSFKY